MIGGSYDGTTATMVAARGDDAPGLAAIVPMAGISRWYGYAYGDGARYFLDSERPAAPVLVDVGPDGTTKTVSRGFLNLQYRNGLARAEPIPPNEPIKATVTFKPQDQTFEAGHRMGVILAGSNTVWAVPDDPGATYTVKSAALELPLS